MGEPALASVIRSDAEALRLKALFALERKVLWLSTWMIHHANFVRPNRDGMKIGGHQATNGFAAEEHAASQNALPDATRGGSRQAFNATSVALHLWLISGSGPSETAGIRHFHSESDAKTAQVELYWNTLEHKKGD